MAARSLVRRVDAQPRGGQSTGNRQRGRGRTERHRLVGRDVHPRHPVAGHAARTDRVWRIGLSGGQSIEGLGDLSRSGRACLDRQPDRDADAARDASVPGGAESRHPAQPQSGRGYQHDRRSVLADARRLLPAARPRQRPRVSGEQSWRAADATAGDVATGDRDGHHRRCSLQPRPRQSRHADPGKEADVIVLDARSSTRGR